MTDLIVHGGALPTYLLDKLVAATGARSVLVQPPQSVVLQGAAETPAFAALVPLLATEGLRWRFAPSASSLSVALADIEALLFDLGNVVVQIDFRLAFAHWGGLAGVAAEQVAERFIASRAYEAHECGEIDGAAYFAALRVELGVELSDTDFLTGWNAIFQSPVPGMPELLAALAAHRPLYLFSNTNAMHHVCWSRKYAGVLGVFSGIFCSHEIGQRKPAPESFQAVAGRIGIAPERLLFFDDLEENVAGARQAGLKAYHFASVESVTRVLNLAQPHQPG